VLRQALIFGPDSVLAVDSFEPANGEMTSSHLLKMLDEGVIDGSAAPIATSRSAGLLLRKMSGQPHFARHQSLL
jgi:hypothetical protein